MGKFTEAVHTVIIDDPGLHNNNPHGNIATDLLTNYLSRQSGRAAKARLNVVHHHEKFGDKCFNQSIRSLPANFLQCLRGAPPNEPSSWTHIILINIDFERPSDLGTCAVGALLGGKYAQPPQPLVGIFYNCHLGYTRDEHQHVGTTEDGHDWWNVFGRISSMRRAAAIRLRMELV